MTKITFSFGKNWQRFLKRINQETIDNSRYSLVNFLKLDNFRNMSFLDIGCGSGLFSYAAFNLGAQKIVSIDNDSFSVACCRYFYEKAGCPKNWEIHQASILNKDIHRFGTFDIVYAWGVLHHTGSMWEAIKSAGQFVNKGGYFYIAIYNKIPGRLGSRFWLNIKRFYNASPKFIKIILEWLYILKFCISNIIRFKNPIKKIKHHSAKRGMSWISDVSDWLGGYPYEFATVEEIFLFVRSNFPDFNLVNISSSQDLGNNSYVFKRGID